jgi:hypothetical protein
LEIDIKMERFYVLVFILAFVGAVSCGEVDPETVDDKKGNIADGDSKITWGPLPEGKEYASNNASDFAGLGVLYKMMHGFLDVVQPHPFPYGKFILLLDRKYLSLLLNS